MKGKDLKERIVVKYLTPGKSYREMADECGVDYRSLHRWVKEYQGRMKNQSNLREPGGCGSCPRTGAAGRCPDLTMGVAQDQSI
ncbi:MAG: hypothetical protein JWQ14_1966 [Adhaeribacter sp.]|nr:hypothetical protein [Adhaeribacter sp.]